ncbi:MAG: nucleotidyltransferase family protein [Acidobacteria bacterium]|nr:nucleotidyltransferase family protein [Acidobacteriota bacterium]
MACCLSTTQQLLLACTRAEVDEAGKRRIGSLIEESQVDWKQFFAEASGHGVFPLVCRNLARYEGLPIPPPVLRRLNVRRRLAAARNVALTAELIEIVDLLNEHGIRALPFKGPVLSAALYGSPCLREFADLDVLVDRRDGKRAVDLLSTHGYTRENAGPSAGRAGSHHILACRRTGVTVELQWDIGTRWGLRPNGAHEAVGFEELWRRRENVSAGPRPLPGPCAEDLALMLPVHGARHLWNRLVWIADVAALVHTRTGIDWRRVVERASEHQCSRRLCVAFHLATELLGIEPHSAMRAAIAKHRDIPALAERVQRLLFQQPESTGRQSDRERLAGDLNEIRLLSSLADGWAERARMRLGYLLTRIPPNALDRGVANLPRPLRAGYCVIRPFRLLWTYLQPE